MATARAKLTSTQDYQLLTCFEEIRKTLQGKEFEDRRSKPLAYWTLPTDRRLPLMFLRRTLGDLLETPFEEIVATPGVGRKKIRALVQLMYRAAREESPPVPFGLIDWSNAPQPSRQGSDAGADLIPGALDASQVPEQLWQQWCDTIHRLGVADLPLGQVAPVLAHVPTVIWNVPLSRYAGVPLEEIRNFRTHGEKRVRCILEVFHSVYNRIHDAKDAEEARARLIAPFAQAVSQWMRQQIERGTLPTVDEVKEHFVTPIMEQIHVDCGPTVYRLACERLGYERQLRSVRAMARQLAVTRARIYQLLDECATVIGIRWPEGKLEVERMVHFWLSQPASDQAAWDLFYRTYQLCFSKGLRLVSDAEEA